MITWGYVAGFFDGDGSLTLFLRKRGKDKGQIEPKLCFSNSNREVMVLLKDFLGVGTINLRTSNQKATFFYRKPQYQLHIGGLDDIIRILKHCLPYLIIKREPAKLVLEFCNLRTRRRHYPYTTKEYELVERIRAIYGRKGWDNVEGKLKREEQ